MGLAMDIFTAVTRTVLVNIASHYYNGVKEYLTGRATDDRYKSSRSPVDRNERRPGMMSDQVNFFDAC